MISFFLTLIHFLKAIINGLKDPELRALSIIVILVITVGTAFYRQMEGWSVIDALYFSVITLTTVGYGDFSPTSPVSKIFTVCYIFVGLGILAGFITKLAAYVVNQTSRQPKGEDR